MFLIFFRGSIGKLKIKNRILKALIHGMSNMDGTVSDRLIRYYTEQARGGVGLVVVEYAYVDDMASKSAIVTRISNNEHIPGLAGLRKQYGQWCKGRIQLNIAEDKSFSAPRLSRPQLCLALYMIGSDWMQYLMN